MFETGLKSVKRSAMSGDIVGVSSRFPLTGRYFAFSH